MNPFPTGACSGVWFYFLGLPTGLYAELSVDAVTGVVRKSYVAHTDDAGSKRLRQTTGGGNLSVKLLISIDSFVGADL